MKDQRNAIFATPPLVSVIIPSFNSSTYINRTLESVANQTYRNFEIVVVDDGSTDNTLTILEQYTTLNVLRQMNKGPSAARNTALEASRGDLIWFLDSDDLILPNALTDAVAVFRENDDCDAVVGKWFFIDAFDQRTSPTIGPDLDLFKSKDHAVSAMLLRTLFPVGASLIKKSCIQKCGGWDESLKCAEDRDLWLRMLLCNSTLHPIPQEVFCYRLHHNNSTLDIDKVKRHSDIFVNKWFSNTGISEKTRSHLLPYALCINYLYLAHKCSEQTTQSLNQELFTQQAIECLSTAPIDDKLLSQIIWESSTKPWEDIVRKLIWKKRKAIAAEYNWRKFRKYVSNREWKPSITYIGEILAHAPIYLLRKLLILTYRANPNK